MANKKSGNGIFGRIYIGKEKDEDYARASLPSNRFQLFFDIFKNSFGKLFYLNILTALFFIPFFVLIIIRSSQLSAVASTYPFSQNLGVGYPVIPSFTDYTETIRMNVNTMILGPFLPLAFFLAGIGLAGGMYVTRNLVWTEGVFTGSDFFKGIGKNFFSVALPMLFFGALYFLIILGITSIDYSLAIGQGIEWLLIAAKVVLYIVAVFFGIVLLYVLSLGVTYKLKPHHLIKNAIILTIIRLPHNLIFAAIAALPFVFYLLGKVSSIFLMLFYVALILIGVSYMMLVWTDYSQGVFDEIINVQIGERTNKGIYEKVSKDKKDERNKHKAYVERSEYAKRPIKPLEDDDSLNLMELPENYTLKDLLALQESKQKIYDDHANYVKEHENDEEFKPTPEELAIEAEKEKELKKIQKKLEKNSYVSNPLFNSKKKRKK